MILPVSLNLTSFGVTILRLITKSFGFELHTKVWSLLWIWGDQRKIFVIFDHLDSILRDGDFSLG